MLKIKIIIIAAVLVYNTFAQRKYNIPTYLEVEELKTRQSSSMLADIAQELIRRSSNSTQILNLNLSNLLLLLILKAVVYGVGYIGNHNFKAREHFSNDNILSEGEVILTLGYLMGNTCLYRAACEVPNTAKQYLGAADMIFNTMQLIPQISTSIHDSYKRIMMEFQQAINFGLKGKCPLNYSCKKESIHRFLQ